MVERSCFKEFSDETRPELLHVGWHIGGCWPSGFCYPMNHVSRMMMLLLQHKPFRVYSNFSGFGSLTVTFSVPSLVRLVSHGSALCTPRFLFWVDNHLIRRVPPVPSSFGHVITKALRNVLHCVKLAPLLGRKGDHSFHSTSSQLSIEWPYSNDFITRPSINSSVVCSAVNPKKKS